MEDREKVLQKVRALYAKAASTDFGPEAEAFQAKADALMLQYALDEAELAKANPNDARYKPEVRRYDFTDFGEFQGYLTTLFSYCAQHCRVKIGEFYYSRATVVGFPGDLDYLDLMFTTLTAHMASTIHPKPDPEATEGENLYKLRMAGLSWEQVWELMRPNEPWNRNKATRWSAVVRKYAENHGLPLNRVGGRGGQANYRTQFVGGYVSRIGQRLAEIEEIRNRESEGKGLVLRDRLDDLTEFLYEQWPEKRPHPEDCDCDRCHQCSDPKCERPPCKAARQPIRRGRTVYVKHHAAAVRAGQQAANSADLGQTRFAGKKELG